MGPVPMGLVKSNFIEKPFGRELALDLVSPGVWHCIRQHFKNAVDCSAELLGGPILRPLRGQIAFQKHRSSLAPRTPAPLRNLRVAAR